MFVLCVAAPSHFRRAGTRTQEWTISETGRNWSSGRQSIRDTSRRSPFSTSTGQGVSLMLSGQAIRAHRQKVISKMAGVLVVKVDALFGLEVRCISHLFGCVAAP
eukprot:TRINITY_DN104993_c0_g1_i1.p3 TRINITY_DN104993_c0_g1~~TRINITY_DN104993_c0_g1_i1.p3  ORF type:complete len:105 (+),score=2.83 TRINITY_DN104993_c0_g1_i1:212-526(+)